MKIRLYRKDDLNSLYAIALATGVAGEDASLLFKDPHLVGHIYAAPYGLFKPELTWVVEDDDGLCGYILGVEDTELWEQQLEDDWWPGLRDKYRFVLHLDDESEDKSHIGMIFKPSRTPLYVSKAYPAHLHLNLLPRARRTGIGARLLHHWLAAAKEIKINFVHVGVHRHNERGLRFWRRHGFVDITDSGDGTVWLGRRTAE